MKVNSKSSFLYARFYFTENDNQLQYYFLQTTTHLCNIVYQHEDKANR